MATVTVRFTGPVRRPWPEASRTLELPAGTTVGRLLQQLGFAGHELRFVHTGVNGASAGPATELADGDTVDVLLRVGGG